MKHGVVFFGYIVLIVRYWCTCVSRTQ